MKGVYRYTCIIKDVDVIPDNCTIYLTKDQHQPSNLLVYSTIQCSTIEIMI